MHRGAVQDGGARLQNDGRRGNDFSIEQEVVETKNLSFQRRYDTDRRTQDGVAEVAIEESVVVGRPVISHVEEDEGLFAPGKIAPDACLAGGLEVRLITVIEG